MTDEEFEAMIKAMMTRLAAVMIGEVELNQLVSETDLRRLATTAAEVAGLEPGVVVTPTTPTPGSVW